MDNLTTELFEKGIVVKDVNTFVKQMYDAVSSFEEEFGKAPNALSIKKEDWLKIKKLLSFEVEFMTFNKNDEFFIGMIINYIANEFHEFGYVYLSNTKIDVAFGVYSKYRLIFEGENE